jgi:hypothetical protein
MILSPAWAKSSNGVPKYVLLIEADLSQDSIGIVDQKSGASRHQDNMPTPKVRNRTLHIGVASAAILLQVL